jgi:ABC-type multidrug transport system fused ATPase/permease subunit
MNFHPASWVSLPKQADSRRVTPIFRKSRISPASLYAFRVRAMKSPSNAPPKLRPRNLLGVLSFLRRYPWRVAIAIGLLLTHIAFEMALPRVSGTAINQLRAAMAAHAPYHPWRLAELFVVLALLRALGAFIAGRVRNFLVQATLKDIRAAFFDSVQRLSFAYHDKTNTGELISRGTADISRLQEFLFACLFLGVDISVAMVATVILIAWISPAAGLATFLALVPTIGLIVHYARHLHSRWRHIHDLHAEMTTAIQENIAGVRVVKAFAREADEISKFRHRRDLFVSHVFSTVSYWASRAPIAQFVFGLSMPLVLWIGGGEVISGRMPVGNLAMIVLYLVGIGNRMNAVGQFVSIVQNASASAERIMEVLEEPRSIRGGTRHLPAHGGALVAFTAVDFAYPAGTTRVLQDISFEAHPGQTVAIVGATGAGKSSLAHLIPRFYDATSGLVRIDGVDVRELDLRELRRSVGMIFQETILFSATVAENVAYGRPEATREQIIAAARAAHAHEFIMLLENGYETVIGERGVSLSGGQKQRLAIARAFLLDPRILILDDATSSLDSKTERLIQEDMRRVCLGRTAFIIAHRLTTVQHADHVLMLKDGRIVERGSPAELMRDGIWFKELFREQWGDRQAASLGAGAAQ